MDIFDTVVLSGAFLDRSTTSSFVVATVVFLGFAIGRSLSMALGGRPNELLIRGLASELVLGALNAFGLFDRLSWGSARSGRRYAAYGPVPMDSSRRASLRTFPLALRGKSSTTKTRRGAL